jgi:hypothetical protein
MYASGLRSPLRLPFPDFLGIGAQKAGTTWLYEMLRHHPDLYLASPKEVHYFDRRFHRTLSYYTRRFRMAQGLLTGEVTPDYATLPESRIRLIRRVMPEARLVYLLRHPVERAWSQAQREVVRRRKRRFEDVPAAEFYAHFQSPASRRNNDYTGNIERWLSAFPEEQLFIGFTDEIRYSPQWLLERIFRHLDVRTDLDWSRIPLRSEVNHRGKVPMPAEFRKFLTELYADEIDRIVARFGARAASWRNDPAVVSCR